MKKIFVKPSVDFVCAEPQSIIAASQIQGAGSNKGTGFAPEARQNNITAVKGPATDISAFELN